MCNGQGLQSDGHFKLASRVAVYKRKFSVRGRVLRRYERPFSVILAWCCVDGSLLQLMTLHRAEAWPDIESVLKPLLKGINRARMQAGFSVDDSMPVFHSTDT